MARMHSRDKGQSKSRRPTVRSVPEWVTIDKKELAKLITKMAKDKKSAAQIGLELRDAYGVPDVAVLLGETITSYLASQKLTGTYPEDLVSLMRRALALRKHFETNRQDKTARRGIQLTDSKINRLVKYYKESNKLDTKFRYIPSELNLYVQ
jgi:small subunit ribosomal protein S15